MIADSVVYPVKRKRHRQSYNAYDVETLYVPLQLPVVNGAFVK